MFIFVISDLIIQIGFEVNVVSNFNSQRWFTSPADTSFMWSFYNK